MIKCLETKIGKIAKHSLFPIEAYCNEINILTVVTIDGRNFNFIEKSFNYEPEYPKKKKIEGYVSRILYEQGIAVPRIMCEDGTKIIYEFIEQKTCFIRTW